MSKLKTYTDDELDWYCKDRRNVEGLLKERDILRVRLDKVEAVKRYG